jgi:hypothetical protein
MRSRLQVLHIALRHTDIRPTEIHPGASKPGNFSDRICRNVGNSSTPLGPGNQTTHQTPAPEAESIGFRLKLSSFLSLCDLETYRLKYAKPYFLSAASCWYELKSLTLKREVES